MALTELLAFIAAAAFVLFALTLALRSGPAPRGIWMFPAALSVMFLAFSLVAVVQIGPFGFWTEHVRNLWGNQIWFDLLLGVGVALAFIVPQAKALGMNVLLWVLVVAGTGCIGLTAMVARLLFLKERRQAAA